MLWRENREVTAERLTMGGGGRRYDGKVMHQHGIVRPRRRYLWREGAKEAKCRDKKRGGGQRTAKKDESAATTHHPYVITTCQ